LDELVTRPDLQTLGSQFDAKLENLKLALTVRLGAMLAAGITILGAINSSPRSFQLTAAHGRVCLGSA
jgi:hypothetical protein